MRVLLALTISIALYGCATSKKTSESDVRVPANECVRFRIGCVTTTGAVWSLSENDVIPVAVSIEWAPTEDPNKWIMKRIYHPGGGVNGIPFELLSDKKMTMNMETGHIFLGDVEVGFWNGLPQKNRSGGGFNFTSVRLDYGARTISVGPAN